MPTVSRTNAATFAPPRLGERLSASLRTVISANESDPAKVLHAAEFLTACGHTEEAGIGLRRAEVLLQARGIRFASADVLQSVNRRFEAARMSQKVASLGDFGARLFSSLEEVVLWTAPRPRMLLVVFGSMYGDLWVSYPVLHCLLPIETTSILYLKDPGSMMFLTGLAHFGPDFDALCAGIRACAAEEKVTDIRIMGYSSGGFGGLLAAARLEAAAYLGLSIRTGLEPQSPLPKDRYVDRADLSAAAGALLADLKPILGQTRPRRGVIYYGARSRIDEAHARHLADVPGFTIQRLPESHHNTVMHLIADGKFDGVIRRFLS